jgi:hypothetical protein
MREKNLRLNCILHLACLYDYGLIDAVEKAALIRQLNSYFPQSTATPTVVLMNGENCVSEISSAPTAPNNNCVSDLDSLNSHNLKSKSQ